MPLTKIIQHGTLKGKTMSLMNGSGAGHSKKKKRKKLLAYL
jgi:hypothetical protein